MIIFLVIICLFKLCCCGWGQVNHDMKSSSRSEVSSKKTSWSKMFSQMVEDLVPIINDKSKTLIFPATNETGDWLINFQDLDTGDIVNSIPMQSLYKSEPVNFVLTSDDKVVFMAGNLPPFLNSYDLNSGKLVWSKSVAPFSWPGEVAIANDVAGEIPTVIYFGDELQSGDDKYSIVGIELGSQDILWQIDNVNHYSSPKFTIESVDVEEDDILYFMNHTTLLQINTKTGIIKNKFETNDQCSLDCWFRKTIISGDLIILQSSYFIYGIDKSTFSLKWNKSINEDSSFCYQPIFSDSGSFFSHDCIDGDFKGHAYVKIRDSKTGEEIVSHQFKKGKCKTGLSHQGTLVGMKDGSKGDQRVVFGCKEKYAVKLYLFEGSEMRSLKKTKNEQLTNMIGDSNDCVFFTSSEELYKIDKLCF